VFNPSTAELNPICHLLALLGAHHILHICRIMVNDSPSRLVSAVVSDHSDVGDYDKIKMETFAYTAVLCTPLSSEYIIFIYFIFVSGLIFFNIYLVFFRFLPSFAASPPFLLSDF
jgi:hypothetical protein